ncbi:YncE family protein [Halocatena pleomorpha]|uniref:YncE family protein n=1 Tax=Halocatena pleomorpha TaxID=1785090 RepID=A0A3P3R3H7_9EURY|nr:hypothetical protein [Halocatena pleomorpha]RRJ28021.1 hypothetical protein EIK79_16690 [Halocatena pleomorpha]
MQTPDTTRTSDRRTTTRSNAATAVTDGESEPTRRAFLRRTATTSAIIVGAGGLPTRGAGRSPPTRDVMVTGNAKNGTVSVSDAQTYTDLRTIDVYPDRDKEDALEDVIDSISPVFLNAVVRDNYLEHASLSPDGRTLYASRGHVGDVVAIDIETGEKLWETNLDGFRADHQTISPDGTYLYVSDLLADQIDKIDTETGAVVADGVAHNLPHGNHLHRVAGFDKQLLINGSLGNMVFPDSALGDPFHHQLTFLVPETMETMRTVQFNEGVRPIAITDDGRWIYVQLSYFHGFHEYDAVNDQITRTKRLPKTDHVPDAEHEYPAQSAHHGIDISGDGKYLCIAATTSWYAAIVRRSDLRLIEMIPVGKFPYWVQTAPDGEHAFVPVRKENEISVINYEAAAEVARIPTGAEPHVTEYGAVPEAIL